jgi:hypothetical protein
MVVANNIILPVSGVYGDGVAVYDAFGIFFIMPIECQDTGCQYGIHPANASKRDRASATIFWIIRDGRLDIF